MGLETMEYEVKEGVAHIRLNRPTAYNAMTEQMNKEITRALKHASKDRDVRCITITGNGKAFCSGQDLKDVKEGTNHAEFLRQRYHPMVREMKKTPKPIIALINGTAAGAGMSLALAADFRLMKQDATFVSAFMNVGLVPDSGFLYMLPRIVGYAKAMEIAVLGRPMKAQEAKEYGLVTEVIAEDDWEEKVYQFTNHLANLPTKAFSLIKRNMMDGMHQEMDTYLEFEAQAQRIAGLTEDHQEGVRSFAEKRKANFQGK